MSWGFEFTGTRVAVLARLVSECEKIAKTYEGSQEAADVLAVKERAIALVNAVSLVPDSYVNWNAVKVKASGSHSTSASAVFAGNFTLSVERTSLCL